jgi:GNAT superfamily N-acetyltransferase
MSSNYTRRKFKQFKLLDDYDNIVSMIDICYDYKVSQLYSECQRECKIIDLYTIRQYQNQGCATYLINQVISFCRKKGINIITLDDCSDNFNQINNIYLKAGFTYIEVGFPEMIKKL